MTKEIDTALERLAEAYVNAKYWVKMHDHSDVHIVKTHYKDLGDKQEKDCWDLEKENAELKEQLIKAKEIIADFENRVHYRKVYVGNITNLMSRAEQFLREILV